MRRSKRRRKPLGEDDVLRAVVCDYVGPAECAINAEAGYTTAVASRAGLVARHTGPQRECAALPLPAESPAERTPSTCLERCREHAAQCTDHGTLDVDGAKRLRDVTLNACGPVSIRCQGISRCRCCVVMPCVDDAWRRGLCKSSGVTNQ